MKKSLLIAFSVLFATQAHASLQELIDNVKQNNKAAVIELLNNGENVNSANKQGNTALHYAVALNNAEMAKILLEYGADMNVSNIQGWTPLKIVEKKKVEDVAAVLHKAQAEAYAEAQAKAQEAMAQAQQQALAAAQITDLAPQPEVKAEIAPVQDTPTSANPTRSEQNIEAVYKVLEQAKAAVIEAKNIQKETALRNQELEKALLVLQAQNAVLTKRVAEYENAERMEQEAELAAKKAAEEAAEKARKAAEEAKAKQAARKAELEKNAPRPVIKKPVYKPRMSDMEKGLYAGDEEIVYCLSYFGNGERSNMRQAAGFFAASAGINEARYNQIAQAADAYFNAADVNGLSKRNDECSRLITPSDAAKQNQIIRSLNRSLR